MAKKLSGVGGVLGGLLSPEPAQAELPEIIADSTATSPVTEAEGPEAEERSAPPAESVKPRPKPQGKIAARRGRPPGQKPGEAADKEKVTLRLNKELMDEYREWSWDERCQLGELVERALSQYRKQRNRQKSQ